MKHAVYGLRNALGSTKGAVQDKWDMRPDYPLHFRFIYLSFASTIVFLQRLLGSNDRLESLLLHQLSHHGLCLE